MSDNNQPTARNDIPCENTWNSESVYASVEAWENELHSIQADLGSLSCFQDHLGESANILFEALDLRDHLVSRVYTAVMWGIVSAEVDKTNVEAAGWGGRAQAVYGQCLAASAFIEPELLTLGMSALKARMLEDPRLAVYDHYFTDLFRKQAHIRSAEVEELLGMLAEPFSNIETTAGMLTDADFSFSNAVNSGGDQVPVDQSTFDKLLSSSDRTLRRSAWESYTDTYLAHKHALTSNLVTSIKNCVFTARARRHANSLEASLFEGNIPTVVFHNLLDTFQKNLPTWRRYFEIRRKALGVDRLEPFDMWAPLTSNRPKIPYRQAVEWIVDGLALLGQEYTAVLLRGCLEERWVDIYPNQGKISGAFSAGAPGTFPFVVMSYTDEIFSLSTLAHELGHSMHSYLTWKNQPLVYSGYSLFVAEVASNFHQAMVRAHLLHTQTDRDFQIGLIEEAMANFYRYFLIMPTLARFELEAHERIERGDSFGANDAIDLLADLYQEVYGDSVYVDRQRVGILWATFTHLYTDYYVYQYATGISGASALSQRILSGTPGATTDYIKFLSAGSSLYPLEALKLAGVDLTTPAPVEQTFAVLAGLVDRLEKLLA